jgi:hypothetical protein
LALFADFSFFADPGLRFAASRLHTKKGDLAKAPRSRRDIYTVM